MTTADLQSALDKLDEAAFAAFRREFGGDFTTRQQYVDDFVHHPEHERRLCQLLGLTTEEDKRTAAGQDSLGLAQEGNRIAEEANAYSASSNLTARQASAVAKKSMWISVLALVLSAMALAIQAFCGSRHAG
jgi:hypothetical protein